jgi:hypothetical protein
VTPRDRLRPVGWPVAWLFLVLPLAWWTISHLAVGWVPHGDTAVAAVRVHDVFGSHTPLLGMPSTSGLVLEGVHAHHPGPLQFQLLAPLYALSGYAPWALVVGLFALVTASFAVSLWAAATAAGARGWVTMTLVQVPALLVAGGALVVPWNPWAAMAALTAAIAAAWAVLTGHGRWWPVFIVAVSLAAQAHLAVAPAMVVLGAVTLMASVVLVRSGRLVLSRRIVVSTIVLGVACWAAPLLDLLRNDPDNLGLLLRVARAGETSLLPLVALPVLGLALWWLHRRGHGLTSGRDTAIVPWLLIGTVVLALSATRAGEGRGAYVLFGQALVLGLAAWFVVCAVGRLRYASTVGLVAAVGFLAVLITVPQHFARVERGDAERAAVVVERARAVVGDQDGPLELTSVGGLAWVDLGPAVYAALLADGHEVYFDARVDGRREDDFRHPRQLAGSRRTLVVQSHSGRAEPPPEGAIVERIELPRPPGATELDEGFVDLVLGDER